MRFLVLDALTYAGNLASLREVDAAHALPLAQADICDRPPMDGSCFISPRCGQHLAANRTSTLDRRPVSLYPDQCGRTATLLEAPPPTGRPRRRARDASAFSNLPDEVYGRWARPFHERTPTIRARLFASKAASDHLVRAWHHPRLTGPDHNCSIITALPLPEKLIPLVILNALDRRPLPVYGAGDNVRDWLYVEDHARALRLVLQRGLPGETYNVGGSNERTNLQVVETICDILDKLLPCAEAHDTCLLNRDKRPDRQPSTSNQQPAKAIQSYKDLITFVTDRPATTDATPSYAAKLRGDWAGRRQETFETGIRRPCSGTRQRLVVAAIRDKK
jgi:dTDP-glucose 4,6-dehydratase